MLLLDGAQMPVPAFQTCTPLLLSLSSQHLMDLNITLKSGAYTLGQRGVNDGEQSQTSN